ncbi:MAG: hypothetical protein A2X56_13270 [Nitrospirae bacterium GWC2_57_13]|nr:MAG: hypothetical protein A2X56_13270 [Nitrospirae bacterium GWC2_57_13]OGW42473.1 MAG: hypothetical protein A2X57_07020 [Nitrospirae bacterium GWD2_57_8]
MKALETASFPEIADRVSALYNEEEDAMMLGMLGKDYVIRHSGIYLHGQAAPVGHAAVIVDYLFSAGDTFIAAPWRSIGDLSGASVPEFRKKVELPLAHYVSEIITRARTLLPHLDAKPADSMISSDMAMRVRALPKVSLHVEMSQETQDFPAEVWVLYSNNALEFLKPSSLQELGELFKERLVSLLRIY